MDLFQVWLILAGKHLALPSDDVLIRVATTHETSCSIPEPMNYDRLCFDHVSVGSMTQVQPLQTGIYHLREPDHGIAYTK